MCMNESACVCMTSIGKRIWMLNGYRRMLKRMWIANKSVKLWFLAGKHFSHTHTSTAANAHPLELLTLFSPDLSWWSIFDLCSRERLLFFCCVEFNSKNGFHCICLNIFLMCNGFLINFAKDQNKIAFNHQNQ